MRTLLPAEVTASARPLGRPGRFGWVNRFFGFGLTPRTLLLLAAGLVWLLPAFFHPERLWLMFAWDGLVLALTLANALQLPAPERLTITRRFLDSPKLAQPTQVELELVTESNSILHVTATDALEASLLPTPEPVTLVAFPRDPVRTVLTLRPGRRGDVRLEDIFLRYSTGLRLIERWAVAGAAQNVRVFPSTDEDDATSSMYLIRARQIEMQKRRLRLRGLGREFESLRDYQRGDELRNISWTATARRARLITREYTTERSQQVWTVIDAGRLSRTAYELERRAGTTASLAAPESTDAAEHLFTVTQLDQATSAAVMLAKVVAGSGDRFGLMTYGRSIQQQLLPGSGPSHLRLLIDQLSQVRAEAAEANHLAAATRLKQMQRRRALVIWITEIADNVGTPEVVSAAVDLVRRHVVLLVMLRHPELDALAARPSTSIEEMYSSAAAKEMLERRRATIVRLRQQGVLVVESSPGELGLRAMNQYLEIKARGLI